MTASPPVEGEPAPDWGRAEFPHSVTPADPRPDPSRPGSTIDGDSCVTAEFSNIRAVLPERRRNRLVACRPGLL